MYTPISPARMRQLVLHGFQQQSTREITRSEIDERVRVEDGQAIAYTYRTHDLFAMWMIPIGLVQFYDNEGNMLQTIDLTAPVTARRRAA